MADFRVKVMVETEIIKGSLSMLPAAREKGKKQEGKMTHGQCIGVSLFMGSCADVAEAGRAGLPQQTQELTRRIHPLRAFELVYLKCE